MSESMPKLLGSVISIAKGKKHEITASPSSKAKRLIGIDDLRNDDLIRYTNDASGTDATSEDVLIAWDGANAGTIGYGKNGYIGSTIARLRIRADVQLFTPFLGIFLKSKFDYLRKTATGATIPHISRKALESIPLPAIDFDEQIRIAHLLGKVGGLIAQRKQHLQQLDDLLKSVFLEMFGDPLRNEKGWDKPQFSELLDDIESGKSPKCEARAATADEWGVLKLGAVTRCRFDGSENKALPLGVPPSVRDEVKAGDLLFSRKNTYELVAACAYVFHTRSRLLMPDLIFRFVFKNRAEINPIFLWKLLTNNSQRKLIQSLAAGAAGSMPNISKTNLKAVRLPIPPLPLQNQFAAIVEKVEALKSRYQKSLTDLETLYGALSQQAFKGELDLSRIPMPAQRIEPASVGDHTTVPTPVMSAATAVNLPETDLLLPALENREQLWPLLHFWLEVYRAQLDEYAVFSVETFMAAAQTRLAELHPDIDFGLGADDYEHIKAWIFEALATGTLMQAFDDAGNRIALKAVQV